MKIQNLSLYYPTSKQQKIIFSRLYFDGPNKGIVAITGDSGVGKSSLLKVIANLIQPQTGKIILPPSSRFLPPLYLSDQLQLCSNWKVSDYLHGRLQESQIKDLGFKDEDLTKTYQQISVGQQVRLKVILFIHHQASVYLLDEPTHALDELNRNKLIEFLSMQASQKLIMIATHDQSLIEKATCQFTLQSPYQTKLQYHHQPSITLTNEEVTKKETQLQLWKRWFRKLESIHQSSFLSRCLSFAISLVQLAIFLSLILTFQIQEQMQQYDQMVSADPWLEVVEMHTIPIHDSPFQIVKHLYPNLESFHTVLQHSSSTKWLVDISNWFPKTIELNQEKVMVRFVDLPFKDDQITAAWIYGKKPLPETLTLATVSLPKAFNTLTFSGPIHQVYHRKPTSWFEPPQLLLSYWQWLSILTHQKTLIDSSLMNYLDAYKTWLPPSQALIYSPNHLSRQILLSLSGHPWRFRIPTENAYPLIVTLMKPLLNFLPFLSCSLLLIWIALWWSRLHWIYQQHHRHWQWMIALQASFKKVWKHVTKKVHATSMLVHGFTLLGAVILLSIQTVIPIPMFSIMLIVILTNWFGLETLKLILNVSFHHA